MYSVEQIKAMGKEKNENNLLKLFEIFRLPVPIDRNFSGASPCL